jgi:hypothetical protein
MDAPRGCAHHSQKRGAAWTLRCATRFGRRGILVSGDPPAPQEHLAVFTRFPPRRAIPPMP